MHSAPNPPPPPLWLLCRKLGRNAAPVSGKRGGAGPHFTQYARREDRSRRVLQAIEQRLVCAGRKRQRGREVDTKRNRDLIRKTFPAYGDGMPLGLGPKMNSSRLSRSPTCSTKNVPIYDICDFPGPQGPKLSQVVLLCLSSTSRNWICSDIGASSSC